MPYEEFWFQKKPFLNFHGLVYTSPNLKIHQIDVVLPKVLQYKKKEKSENEEKYSNIKMAAFGIKNVHCVLLVQMEDRRGI